MGIKGDFAKLARLQAKLKSLATDDTYVRLNNVVGAAALAQVQLGFRTGTDPYGRAWPGLVLRSGKPLLNTGRLRSSFSYQASRRSFTIGTNVAYAKTHQRGMTITPVKGRFLRFPGGARTRGAGGRFTRSFIYAKKVTIPRRMMVPEGTLGTVWSKVFRDTGNRFVARLMKAP
jgi:phage gpG-like protein